MECSGWPMAISFHVTISVSHAHAMTKFEDSFAFICFSFLWTNAFQPSLLNRLHVDAETMVECTVQISLSL